MDNRPLKKGHYLQYMGSAGEEMRIPACRINLKGSTCMTFQRPRRHKSNDDSSLHPCSAASAAFRRRFAADP